MLIKLYGLIGVLMLLGGCAATPDLEAWANKSAELKTSVASAQKDLLGKTDDTFRQFELGKIEGWGVINDQRFSEWKERRERLAKNIAIVDATMNAMVGYAEIVSSLAAKGETGEEASKSLIKSFTSILDTLGKSYPGGEVVSSGVEFAMTEVSKIATNVQAQNALAETMKLMEGEGGAIAKLVEQLRKATGAMNGLVVGIGDLQEVALTGKYGENRLVFYHSVSAYEEMEKMYQDAIDEKKAVGKLADTLFILERISGIYREYNAERQALADWRRNIRKSLTAINESADAWAKSHSEAAELMIKCGGLRSLRPRCGNLTLANLMLAKGKVDGLIASFKSPDALEPTDETEGNAADTADAQ